MKEQLISYVNLLFAGNADCDDVRQEILQNILDRYDDLLAGGKSPEAAYRLAIGGIGDINEILGQEPPRNTPYREASVAGKVMRRDTPVKKALRAVAVALYIMCPLPLLAVADTGLEIYGLCGLLTFVAVATALIMLGSPSKTVEEVPAPPQPASPKQELWHSIRVLVSIITLVVYFGVSFATMAWHITWLIFLISAALDGLLKAILDLKESVNHET